MPLTLTPNIPRAAPKKNQRSPTRAYPFEQCAPRGASASEPVSCVCAFRARARKQSELAWQSQKKIKRKQNYAARTSALANGSEGA